jgi:hypothetical protein
MLCPLSGVVPSYLHADEKAVRYVGLRLDDRCPVMPANCPMSDVTVDMMLGLRFLGPMVELGAVRFPGYIDSPTLW